MALRFYILLFLCSFLSSCGNHSNEVEHGKLITISKDGDFAQILAIRAENKKWVEQCYSQMQGDLVRVDTGKRFHSARALFQVEYEISKNTGKPGRLGLYIKVALRPRSCKNAQEEQDLIDETLACLPTINQFFDRYGIDSNFVLERYNPTSRGYFKMPAIKRYQPSDKLSTDLLLPGRPYYCNGLIHEFGHYLGLDDEYEDENHPGRWESRETSPYSIMACSHMDFELVDLYPRHIREILRPACSILE